MKIIYLLPPSEGKNIGGHRGMEKLSFHFQKPTDIALKATEKDLKCTGKRYEEGIQMNKNIDKSEKLQVITRYSGVMYNAINYSEMSEQGKKYFDENFLILSGMYGILRPQDMIGNYKLPIETKGLLKFWDTKITKTLNNLQADLIVDLLPLSYKKMIQWKNIQAKVLRVEFMHTKNGEHKKMTHGVKKVKGEWIHELCENESRDILVFGDKGEEVIEINR